VRGIGDTSCAEDKMKKINPEQKADIARRIQVKNPDGTWAVSYKAIAAEFGVSPCLISHIAKRAGLPQRERGPQHFPFAGERYHPPAQLWDMYQELRGKLGMAEARRLIQDHMRIRKISHEHIDSSSAVDVEPIAA
jgi:hypothetical protein